MGVFLQVSCFLGSIGWATASLSRSYEGLGLEFGHEHGFGAMVWHTEEGGRFGFTSLLRLKDGLGANGRLE